MKAQTQGSRPPGLAKPSALRVLLWKEWRQQRWTAAGMTALALGLYALGGSSLGERWSFDLSFAAFVFVLLGVPLVLSAQAFAGEDEEGTAAFLRGLPFRPQQVFAAKFLTVLLASWAASGLLLLLGRMWSDYPDSAVRGFPWTAPTAAHAWQNLPAAVGWVGIWLLAPTTAALASLLASLGLRPLTTALLNGVWLCLCIAGGALSVLLLDTMQVCGLVWAVAAVGVPAFCVLLAAWLSARRHHRKWVQFLRGGGGCAAVLALFLLPGALAHGYVKVLAPPTYYVRSDRWHRAQGWVNAFSVPPTSRPAAIALECELAGAPGASLLALLDLSTGRTAWSGAWPAPMNCGARSVAWSPDGSRVTWGGVASIGIRGTYAWPTHRKGALTRQIQGAATARAELRVYDVRKRRTIRVPGDPASDMFERCNSAWYNTTWLAALWLYDPGRLGVAFLNTDNGAAHICPVPWPERVDVANYQAGLVVLPDRAVFAAIWRDAPVARGRSELLIARCTPSAAAATLLLVRDLPSLSTELRAVSPDAQWALLAPDLWTWEGPRPNLALVDLATGASRPLGLPPGVLEHMAKARSGRLTAAFATGGTHVLVDLHGIGAVYDLKRDAWQVYVPPVPEDSATEGWGVCVSPNGERVLQVFPPGRGRADDQQAVILDLVSGQWTTVPMAFHGAGGRVERDVRWCGNEHLLALNPMGVWRFGLDGSTELLYPCSAIHRAPEVVERASGPRLADLVAWSRQVVGGKP
jgi:hypothetical protein